MNVFSSEYKILRWLVFRFFFVRYTQQPANSLSWYNDYLKDEDEKDVEAGGGQLMKKGSNLAQSEQKLD